MFLANNEHHDSCVESSKTKKKSNEGTRYSVQQITYKPVKA
ncbi:Uncharacterised protein [Myroides odoratus]|uniref:Uncharacterized protein n=1 Tax=Myroides odoratus TaxID=256 RepID=A0A378RP92_MYROD|nr:Uncharacterised protein [Myroides odoratus]